MEYLHFLKNTFLFSGISEDNAEKIYEIISPKLETFARSEIIYSPDSYSSKIGFVLEGECSICRVRSNRTTVPLNSLKPYDSFGVTAVFSKENHFPTQISAKKATKVVFLTGESLHSAIKAYPEVAVNIITFLTGRVEFLNKKIATLTSCGCEEKLASLLYNEYKKAGADTFSLNCKSAAESLGIGRASLYRGIKALSDEGYISYVDNKIFIKDPKGLEGITK